MKKSVIILIAVIYIASIGIVSFFGLKPKTFGEEILISSIEIIDSAAEVKDGIKTVKIKPDENGIIQYKINYVVGPENATDTSVNYIYDRSDPCVSIDEETGIVTFDKSKMLPAGSSITITVEAAKGDAQDTIKITAKHK